MEEEEEETRAVSWVVQAGFERQHLFCPNLRRGVPPESVRSGDIFSFSFSSPDVAVVLEKRESQVNISTVGEVLISR